MILSKFICDRAYRPKIFHETFGGFQQRVTREMNEDLTRPITEEEVRNALFDMYLHKAPEQDGFSAVFYQKCWEEIKTEIMREISDFFDTGE